MKTHPAAQLTLVVLLILAFTLPTAAQQPTVDGPKAQPPIDSAPPSPDATPQKTPDGRWFMSAGSRSDLAAATAPQASGGPDDFGYTWTDTEPLDWIRCQQRNRHRHQQQHQERWPDRHWFPFQILRETRVHRHISHSTASWLSTATTWGTVSLKSPTHQRVEVIAPHWAPVNDVAGYVRFLRGGSAPNRWFAVEWNRLRSYCCNDAAEEYSFETILHESGDIVSQYGTMTHDGGYFCQASGIEDTTGLDGLATSPWCEQVAANHAIRITRPVPAARRGCIRRHRALSAPQAQWCSSIKRCATPASSARIPSISP